MKSLQIWGHIIKLIFTKELDSVLANAKRLWVGFSGGIDSTVLLHNLHNRYKDKVLAIHVNHSLNKKADSWQEHCIEHSKHLSIPIFTCKVYLDNNSNIEALARDKRYAVFQEYVEDEDCLVLAHHADDQIETLLMRFFRGSGVDGLSAMQSITQHNNMQVIRPLLNTPKSYIEEYAKFYSLNWIEDDSNFSLHFLRNRIRHELVPLVKKIWPTAHNNLLKSTEYFNEISENLSYLALIDSNCNKTNNFNISILQNLPIARQKNALYYWLKNNNIKLRSKKVLDAIIKIIHSKEDAKSKVQWDEYCILRYKDMLYIKSVDILQKIDNIYVWQDLSRKIPIVDNKFISAEESCKGISIPKDKKITLRFRQGGERIRWHGQNKYLKNLWQEWEVPPWERDLIPLIYIEDILACVVGYAYSDLYYKESRKKQYYAFKVENNKG